MCLVKLLDHSLFFPFEVGKLSQVCGVLGILLGHLLKIALFDVLLVSKLLLLLLQRCLILRLPDLSGCEKLMLLNLRFLHLKFSLSLGDSFSRLGFIGTLDADELLFSATLALLTLITRDLRLATLAFGISDLDLLLSHARHLLHLLVADAGIECLALAFG